MSKKITTIIYDFKFSKGEQKQFTIRLRVPAMELVAPWRAFSPAWTHLTNHQCTNCPLDPAQHPHCPIAFNLVEVIEFFKDSWSTESADITVKTEGRDYHKKVPLPVGVSSLIGLHMVTSGCPIMDKLRPMVKTHLPFANVEETTYRAISMYLLSQYFVLKHGGKPDWELKDLVKIYDEINEVNRCFCDRIKSIQPRDASLNAIYGLDCFATVASLSIVENALPDMEALFDAYLKVPAAIPQS